MRGVLPFGEDKQVQFVNQDDEVYDQPTIRYYQRKIPLLPKPSAATHTQDGQVVTKKTIPITMAEGKDQFQVGKFFDTPVTHSI